MDVTIRSASLNLAPSPTVGLALGHPRDVTVMDEMPGRELMRDGRWLVR